MPWKRLLNLRGPAGTNEANAKFTALEAKDTQQDGRLTALENSDTAQNSRLTGTEQKNTDQDSRLDNAETKNTAQDNRLNAVESKNFTQDDRLVELEHVAPVLAGDYEELLFGVVDAAYRRTWLEAEKSKGFPSTYSMQVLNEVLGVSFDSNGSALAAITDAAGRYTDIHLDDQGHIADRVMDVWAPRIASRLPGIRGGLATGDRMVVDGDLVPVFPDVTEMTGWGSSSIDRMSDALTGAMLILGVNYYDEGMGGELIEEHAARLGSTPALITVTGGSIPASGTVAVTSPMRAVLKPFTGTLAGVPGTLTWPGQVHGQLEFTRTAAGDAVPVPADTPFIPDVGMASRNHVTLLWAGKGDLSTAGTASHVITETNKMFDFLSPLVKRCLVLTHFINSTETPGSTQHTQVNEVNAAYLTRYGTLCLDVNAYLLSDQVWTDTGLTPTGTDLAQQADGVKPDSLSADNGHLNAAGYTAVTNLIVERLQLLGWY